MFAQKSRTIILIYGVTILVEKVSKWFNTKIKEILWANRDYSRVKAWKEGRNMFIWQYDNNYLYDTKNSR